MRNLRKFSQRLRSNALTCLDLQQMIPWKKTSLLYVVNYCCWMSISYLFLLLLVLPIDASKDQHAHHGIGHLCAHQPPEDHEVGRVHLEHHHVIRKRSTFNPLRIKVHYDHSVKNLPAEKFAVINNTILPSALNYWKQALLVKPLGVPIRLNRKCANNKAFFQTNRRGEIHQYCVERCELITTCGEVTVPETHLEVCSITFLQSFWSLISESTSP